MTKKEILVVDNSAIRDSFKKKYNGWPEIMV